MTKAGTYTQMMLEGKKIAEWHEGYINSYMDYENNVPVTYFVYRNGKTHLWYAVDIATGMAITRAEKRKDLTRLDYKIAERLYAIKKTEDYKEMMEQFALLVEQGVKS